MVCDVTINDYCCAAHDISSKGTLNAFQLTHHLVFAGSVNYLNVFLVEADVAIILSAPLGHRAGIGANCLAVGILREVQAVDAAKLHLAAPFETGDPQVVVVSLIDQIDGEPVVSDKEEQAHRNQDETKRTVALGKPYSYGNQHQHPQRYKRQRKVGRSRDADTVFHGQLIVLLLVAGFTADIPASF